MCASGLNLQFARSLMETLWAIDFALFITTKYPDAEIKLNQLRNFESPRFNNLLIPKSNWQRNKVIAKTVQNVRCLNFLFPSKFFIWEQKKNEDFPSFFLPNIGSIHMWLQKYTYYKHESWTDRSENNHNIFYHTIVWSLY